MIPTEQAHKYISRFKKADLKKEDFHQFSAPYQKLGWVLTQLKKDQYNYYTASDLTASFAAPETMNPWSSKEGMQLGVFVWRNSSTLFRYDVAAYRLPSLSGRLC